MDIPKEELTFNRRLNTNDAISQLGYLTGLDDATIKQKLPDLANPDYKSVVFRNTAAREDVDGDVVIYIAKGEAAGADICITLAIEDGDLKVIEREDLTFVLKS